MEIIVKCPYCAVDNKLDHSKMEETIALVECGNKNQTTIAQTCGEIFAVQFKTKLTGTVSPLAFINGGK